MYLYELLLYFAEEKHNCSIFHCRKPKLNWIFRLFFITFKHGSTLHKFSKLKFLIKREILLLSYSSQLKYKFIKPLSSIVLCCYRGFRGSLQLGPDDAERNKVSWTAVRFIVTEISFWAYDNVVNRKK